MLRATVKGLLGHKLRLALTTLAVVLGVGFVAGSFVFTDTLGGVFDRLFADTLAGVDVNIRATSELDLDFGQPDRIPESLLDTVRTVEGVAEAWGTIGGLAQLVGPDGELIGGTGPPTLGLSWPATERPIPYSLREGRPPAGPGEVVIDAAVAARTGLAPGNRVELIFAGRPAPFTIVGVAGFGEADNLAGASFVLVDLATAQAGFDAAGTLDTIDIALADGTTAAQVIERLSAVLPPQTEAITAQSLAEESAAEFKQGLSFFNTFLLVFAGVALFVGTFIIHNTFRIIVAQRTRELALLRAIGAEARQVTGMVLAEALVIGLLASLVGIGFGIGLAVGVREVIGALGGELPQGPLVIAGRTIAVALVVGVVVTGVSALLPARRAARVPPVAAMRDLEPLPRRGLTRRAVPGTLITLIGAGLVAAGLFASVEVVPPITLVGAGAAVLFLGVSVLGPVFARPIASTLGAPLPRLYGLPGLLARQNAIRSPRRTAATASALMIGLALVTLALILASSFKATIGELLTDSFRFDFAISSDPFGPQGFPPTVAEDVGGLPEVDRIARVRSGPVLVGEDTRLVAAVDSSLPEFISFDVAAGDLADLGPGKVAVQEDRGQGVAVGDTLEMTFEQTGRRTFTVAALWTAQEVNATYLITMEDYEANFADRQDWSVYVHLAPGVDPAAGRAALEGVVDAYPQVLVQDQTEVRESAEQQVNGLLSLIFGLLALAIIIALFGITNTLSLSVIERTREIGLLRAIGLARRQLRRAIRWEAVIIAVFGALLGVAVGILFGWAVVRALRDQGLTVLAVPLGQLAIAVAVAGLAGIGAAVLPAWRASRIDVLQAIAYE